MSKRVLIRADAGPSIGGGHVYRTSVLGAHLQRRGYKVFYATRAESREAVPSLLSQGFEIVDVDPLAPPEEPDFLAEKIGSVDLFVLDHYQRGIEFEQAVRPFSTRSSYSTIFLPDRTTVTSFSIRPWVAAKTSIADSFQQDAES